MADPLKQMCDELGVCTEEALFYLEGFRWDLNEATEACRSKTLPSLAADQPPSSENERAAAENRLRNEKIERFLQVAIGSTATDAVKYLSDKNWNLDQAASSFFDHSERKSDPMMPLSHDGHTAPWYLHGLSGSGGSDLVQDVLSNVPQFRNPSTNVRIGSPPPSASTAPFELKQESIKEFREILPEAPSQAVIDCLNHCKGNVKNAISYFNDVYSKKPPPGIATAQVVKNFSVDQDPSTASPLVEESSSPTQTRELSPPLTHDELIDLFVAMAGGVVTRDVAPIYLAGNNWDVDEALSCLLNELNPTPAQPSQEGGETGSSSRDPPLPSTGVLPSQSQFDASSGPTETQGPPEEGVEGDVTVAIPGMASSQMEVDGKAVEEGSSAETVPDPSASTAPFELKQESIKQFRDLFPEASPKAVIDCLNHCKGNVADAMDYFCGAYSEAKPVVEESGNATQTLPVKGEESAEVKEEHIGSFVKMTGATREDAIAYLDHFKWNVDEAVKFFQDNGYSGEVLTAMSMSLMEDKDLPLPSMGVLPSQSQFESSYVSSETQGSPEEGDVTVAIPGMSSSQVDGKAGEKGSSTETVPDPIANRDRTTVETQTAPSTIVLTITLGDMSRTTLELPFRSNQTVRDIHDAIDQRYPDNARGYHLQSMDGVDYMDENITVSRVSTGDSTSLLQIYP